MKKTQAKKIPLNELTYEDIKVGDTFSFKKVIDKTMVQQFAELTGDYNPLHTDDDYAKTTMFKARIAHGMLLGGLFSPLMGMLCPGKKCLYLSQSLHFRAPVKMGTEVSVEGEVVSKSDAVRAITLNTVIKDAEGKVVVEGKAQVKVGHEKAKK